MTKRIASYDVIRVVSMFFVVAVHSLIAIDIHSNLMALSVFVLQTIFFTANPMFFMLSGRFNIKTDYRKLSSYYARKITTIVIPVLLYFLLRTLCGTNYGSFSLGGLTKNYLINTLGNYADIEYWFIFSLVGYLSAAPFFGPSIAKLNNCQARWFISIGLLYQMLVFVFSNIGVRFEWSYPFSGFVFSFCLGSCFDKIGKITNKKSIVCISIGLLGTVLAKSIGWMNYIQDLSPFFTMISIGMFSLIKNTFETKSPSATITWLSKRSFGVYLIHGQILNWIYSVLNEFGLLFRGTSSVISFLLLFASTTACSIAISLIFDRYIVTTAQRACSKLPMTSN